MPLPNHTWAYMQAAYLAISLLLSHVELWRRPAHRVLRCTVAAFTPQPQRKQPVVSADEPLKDLPSSRIEFMPIGPIEPIGSSTVLLTAGCRCAYRAGNPPAINCKARSHRAVNCARKPDKWDGLDTGLLGDKNQYAFMGGGSQLSGAMKHSTSETCCQAGEWNFLPYAYSYSFCWHKNFRMSVVKSRLFS